MTGGRRGLSEGTILDGVMGGVIEEPEDDRNWYTDDTGNCLSCSDFGPSDLSEMFGVTRCTDEEVGQLVPCLEGDANVEFHCICTKYSNLFRPLINNDRQKTFRCEYGLAPSCYYTKQGRYFDTTILSPSYTSWNGVTQLDLVKACTDCGLCNHGEQNMCGTKIEAIQNVYVGDLFSRASFDQDDGCQECPAGRLVKNTSIVRAIKYVGSARNMDAVSIFILSINFFECVMIKLWWRFCWRVPTIERFDFGDFGVSFVATVAGRYHVR